MDYEGVSPLMSMHYMLHYLLEHGAIVQTGKNSKGTIQDPLNPRPSVPQIPQLAPTPLLWQCASELAQPPTPTHAPNPKTGQ